MEKKKYAIAAAFTTLIFFIGILIGSRILGERASELQGQLQSDLLEMQSLELELSIVNRINSTSLCSYIEYRLPDIVKKKVELGRKFDIGDIPEEQAGILKKQYTISLGKYWLFSEVNRVQCGINKPNIVFFFDTSEQSREQGRVLDYLVYRSGENITVFAFSAVWDEPLLRLFMINYNVTAAPTVIIDGTSYSGLQTRENISSVICKSYNMSFC